MTDEPTKTETLILLAKWAESAERYDDMANYMQEVRLSSLIPFYDAGNANFANGSYSSHCRRAA